MIKQICEQCGNDFFVYPYRVKNKSVKFCSKRCNARNRTGEKNGSWTGGRHFNRGGNSKGGYISVLDRSHPRAHKDGYVYEHILIAETIIGKPLPLKAEIHHFNGNGTDNSHSNLIVCQDRAYHFLLHKRQKIQTKIEKIEPVS